MSDKTETDYKIDQSYLEGRLAELQKQVGGKLLLPIFIEQTRKVLAKDAKAYLRYGPYWWAMKRILRAGGVAVGNYDEPIWADEYTYRFVDGDPHDPMTLLAGWEFADDNMGNVGVLTNEYDLAGRTFVLHDPDQTTR